MTPYTYIQSENEKYFFCFQIEMKLSNMKTLNQFLLTNQDETKEVGHLFGDLFNFVFNLELRFFKADKNICGNDTIFKSENEKSILVVKSR